MQRKSPLVHWHDCPPGSAVAVYETMAAPPELEGASHAIVALALPCVVCTFVGAPGTLRGITADDAVLATPLPAEFAAVTTNVYAVPFASPDTVHRSGPDDQAHC